MPLQINNTKGFYTLTGYRFKWFPIKIKIKNLNKLYAKVQLNLSTNSA